MQVCPPESLGVPERPDRRTRAFCNGSQTAPAMPVPYGCHLTWPLRRAQAINRRGAAALVTGINIPIISSLTPSAPARELVLCE